LSDITQNKMSLLREDSEGEKMREVFAFIVRIIIGVGLFTSGQKLGNDASALQMIIIFVVAFLLIDVYAALKNKNSK